MPFKPVDYAVEISIGPLIDDTDFKSLETAVAYNESGMSVDLFIETTAGITKTDITPTSGGAYAWTHKGNGIYRLVIPASDNDTCGVLWIVGVCDGVLPFESPRYTIVPANVYDGFVAGTDKLKVHTDEITDGLIDDETRLHGGTAQAGGASTITLAAGAVATDDYYKHSIVAITAGTGAGQAGVISSYVGSTRVATMTAAWATQPDNTSIYVVLPLGTLPLDSDGVNAACDAAIETYRLHELMTTELGGQPATGSLLGDLTGDDGGTQRFTANALELAPTDSEVVEFACATALESYRLNELMVNELSDPPGSGSLFGDLTEDDDGTQRFTANALEQGPAGDGETQLHSGTAQAGGASTITLAAGAVATDDYYKHSIVAITAGTGAGQAGVISSYVGSTRVATMTAAWATQPDGTSQYVILPFGTVAGVVLSDATEADIDAIKAKTDLLNFTGTDVKATLDGEGVDATKIDGSATAAERMKTAAQTIVTGQAVAGTLSTTQMTTDLTEVTDDHYNGRQLLFTSGTLMDQATEITGYDGSSKKLIFTALTEAPQVGDAFTIV